MTLVGEEPSVKYHPYRFRVLIPISHWETVPVGQFDWGGFLLKCNGGVQRYLQPVWKSGVEYKDIRVLDCEADKLSRCESRA